MTNSEPTNVSRIRQIISLIDLTNLDEQCDSEAIASLCQQADTPVGSVAALCVWPRFVPDAKKLLGQNSPVKVATVVNFPTGSESPETTRILTDNALKSGADEIDYVLPYRELINGNVDLVSAAVDAVRSQIPRNKVLKVILETGILESNDLIRRAAQIAIDQGANFIKTSTGKVPVNATESAGTIMLETIACSNKDIGFKAAGGIKTIDVANRYLNLAEKQLGQSWVDPGHFRFGASGLLQDALINLDLAVETDKKGDY